jgi:Family of unknown function (DUF7003)
MTMRATTYTVETILEQLDHAARTSAFPMLDNGYNYPIAVYLRTYRDPSRWAIVIDDICFHNRCNDHDGIWACCYYYGNCLTTPATLRNPTICSVTSDAADGPTFTTIDTDAAWLLHPAATAIIFRTTRVLLPTEEAAFIRKGIQRARPPRTTIVEALRCLMPDYRELLITTADEVQRIVPSDLPELLHLTAWEHPDRAADQLPSETETFPLLAEVLITGDPQRYCPTRPANTHWRYWPTGGEL